jgi:acetyl-CoA C-acetyltransferase
MPYLASISTHLPCWGSPRRRVAGVEVAEVHDCFTGIELIGYEDLGFAERIGADRLLEAKDLEGPVAHGG